LLRFLGKGLITRRVLLEDLFSEGFLPAFAVPSFPRLNEQSNKMAYLGMAFLGLIHWYVFSLRGSHLKQLSKKGSKKVSDCAYLKCLYVLLTCVWIWLGMLARNHFLFFFLAVLEFELRVSHLLGRHCYCFSHSAVLDIIFCLDWKVLFHWLPVSNIVINKSYAFWVLSPLLVFLSVSNCYVLSYLQCSEILAFHRIFFLISISIYEL
jgi:hypothetical protein